MAAETVARQVMDDAQALSTPFIRALAALLRADDTYGVWEDKPDSELLGDYVVTAEARRQIPIIGDPDPDQVERVEKFYRAVGLALERETGLMATPMMSLHYEGFGRVIVTTGKLVVLARSLRDVHRFGFSSLAALAEAGTKLVEEARREMAAYPQVARA
ncbi:NifX-associated nitrogen fixation protein [Afifella pfennigii]|uniref:NifX-associated nitrogen fixation protein n=1 Tax=Afifella pfennigii TaxID=209897 RepID=UPI00047BF812|nr:NifX-associated nitrogen fixation protein [Afifella pfennigii]